MLQIVYVNDFTVVKRRLPGQNYIKNKSTRASDQAPPLPTITLYLFFLEHYLSPFRTCAGMQQSGKLEDAVKPITNNQSEPNRQRNRSYYISKLHGTRGCARLGAMHNIINTKSMSPQDQARKEGSTTAYLRWSSPSFAVKSVYPRTIKHFYD